MKTLITNVLVLTILLLSGCIKIHPGYAGVEVDQYGQNKGVQDYPLVTGMVWFNPFTKTVISYPCFIQTAVWTKNLNEGRQVNEEITFNTAEGLVVSGDISLSYQLKMEKVPSFYVKFRTDEIDTFTHGFLRNVARDAFNEIGSTYKVEDVYGLKKEELLKAVKSKVNIQIEPYGIIVEQFGFIGALGIPEIVTKSLNAKISATQDAIRVENELRSVTAEAAKTVAAAKGQADANLLLAKSITPELIQWRQLQIAADTISKWDGKRPMVEGNANGIMFQLPLNK